MANKVYRAVETAITFRDSGGDVVLALQNMTFGTGQISARYDRGAGSLAQLHEVRAVIQFESSTGTLVGTAVEIYLFQSDGTYMDGTLGTSSAAMGSDKRKNGMLIGAVIGDTESAATDIIASFQNVPISSRYYSIGVWNAATGDNLENTANASRIIVTPMPPELQ